MINNIQILQDELEILKKEIIDRYNASNKLTSGEFAEGLEITSNDTAGSLFGYVYLAGRKAGKQPPIDAIKDWLEQKGIKPIENKMKISSLAFLIARKIAREGTAPENHLFIYDEIITPERIDKIFQKISQLNVNEFVKETQIMIQKLVQNK